LAINLNSYNSPTNLADCFDITLLAILARLSIKSEMTQGTVGSPLFAGTSIVRLYACRIFLDCFGAKLLAMTQRENV